MKRNAWIALIGFSVIAAFFLWEEHRAHLLGVLPWAILLLCPILHLFLHRDHGMHGGSEDRRNGGGGPREGHDGGHEGHGGGR